MNCLAPKCDRNGDTRGLCRRCYHQWITQGKPDTWQGVRIPKSKNPGRPGYGANLIMKTLRRYAGVPLTPLDLVEETGLSRSGVGRLTRQLAAEGRIKRRTAPNGRGVTVVLPESQS